MIYSFFAADDASRPGFGNYIIIDHILRARGAGLPYVYLGYWVKGSGRMEYKIRYRPIEALGPGGWSRLSEDDLLAAAPGHGPGQGPGQGKD
jgi:arginyl-tRNA--protein-N-Asp/Glu arginylyltransferase